VHYCTSKNKTAVGGLSGDRYGTSTRCPWIDPHTKVELKPYLEWRLTASTSMLRGERRCASVKQILAIHEVASPHYITTEAQKVVYEIVARCEPHADKDPSKIYPQIRDNFLTPEIPNHSPQKLRQLMQMCWNKQPAQRPDFEMICTMLEQQ